MKKIIALALALIMTLSMASVAFAAGTTYEAIDAAALVTAINNAGDGDTIKLTGDAVFDETSDCMDPSKVRAIIISGKELIIDLNGYTISATSVVTDAVLRVQQDAVVTVKNGSITSDGTMTTILMGNKNAATPGAATLTLENVNVTSTGHTVKDGAQAGGALRVNCGSVVNLTGTTTLTTTDGYHTIETKGTVTMEDSAQVIFKTTGTKTVSDAAAAVCVSGDHDSTPKELNSGIFNMTGGSVTSDTIGIHVLTSGGTANVEAGEVKAEIALGTITGGHDGAASEINVTGGKITGSVQEVGAAGTTSEVNISGGTFTKDVTEFLAPGAEVTITTGNSNPGKTIVVSNAYARADYKVKSYDFTTGTKGYKGASYIDEIKINKDNQLVIVLKDNFKLAEDKAVKGEIVLQSKADKKVTVTIPVEYLVKNNVEEISGSRKSDEATVITPAENAMYVMDEEGGYVTFTEEALTGTVKMNKEEKAFLNIWYGYIEEVTEDSIDAFEAFVGEDYIDEAIIEYYTFETRAFKNEVSFAFDAWEDDPHYFYLWDGEKLSAIDAKYDDDEDVEAYVWTGLAEGTIIVTDVEIVLAAEETSKNPNTGASDVVGMASALAVVSLVAAGAISLKK